MRSTILEPETWSPFLLFVGFLVALVTCRPNPTPEQFATAATIAADLGLANTSLIAQEFNCVDLGDRCGIYNHFITNDDLETFHSRVEALPLTLETRREVDGFTIFTDLNLGGERRLTADGRDGISNRDGIEDPYAIRWFLVDLEDKQWFITFYLTEEVNQEYRVDDLPLKGNLVTVIYQIKE